jgi:hypothetical protein
MKHAKQVRAESSAATVKDQTSKLLEDFDAAASCVLGTFEDNFEIIMSDNMRGALYILRNQVKGLIEAGRALAGLPAGDPAAESPRVAPGEMLATWADGGGTGLKPFGPGEPSEDIKSARWHIGHAYKLCSQLEFDDGICSLNGLRACLEGNPGLEPEREALRAFSKGLEQVDALRRSCKGLVGGLGRPLTGAETWLGNKLGVGKPTLEAGLILLCQALDMLNDTPVSKDSAEAVDLMMQADSVLTEVENYNDSH